MTRDAQIRNYIALKHERDQAKRHFEEIDADLKRERQALYDRMEDEGVDSQRIDGVLVVRPDPTWYHTMQDRDQFHAWARENNPSLLKTREEGELLNALVRECIEDGRPLPPGLGAYPRPTIQVRK